ncbi:hypothetical protein BOTBODRAFT_51620 [Botryobasidium botryosum FD-172 SS1]|uniref:Uncharacterized protein n=1 Tax=Botryobasidium botryosum (strain FD-172 SS1) TaxID=930990 RepID=A0A067N982_BOTB1|nr:hypothetical protein BOTBODRAFT_51620 [Botryobasidium botryosum FD-172 SS1]
MPPLFARDVDGGCSQAQCATAAPNAGTTDGNTVVADLPDHIMYAWVGALIAIITALMAIIAWLVLVKKWRLPNPFHCIRRKPRAASKPAVAPDVLPTKRESVELGVVDVPGHGENFTPNDESEKQKQLTDTSHPDVVRIPSLRETSPGDPKVAVNPNPPHPPGVS